MINDMDPILRVWLYEQWLGDHQDDAELAKNHAYLVGSFWNPEAVKQLMNDNVHQSTDEEFEQSSQFVKDSIKAQEEKKQNNKKRKRRTLKQG
jgi:hypothetical protein